MKTVGGIWGLETSILLNSLPALIAQRIVVWSGYVYLPLTLHSDLAQQVVHKEFWMPGNSHQVVTM